MDLPRRRFGGVDPAAAKAAVDEQRRIVADLTEHLARVEGQLEAVKAERDASNARLAEMEGQIADVLRLATRAATETEAETAARVTEATEQAQKRVDDLAVEAAVAAETAATLARSLEDAVAAYRAMDPIEIHIDVARPATAPAPEVVPEEPFVLEEEVVVVEEPEAPTPEPGEQPPTYTSVVARPLPSPAAAVDVEQRLASLPGVREVTLAKLGSTEATFTVAHDPGALDLTPLTRLGVPVAVA